MNDLSWMLYLADVVGNFGFVLGFVGILSGVVFAVAGGFCIVCLADNEPEDAALMRRVAQKAALFAALLIVPAMLMPTSSTIYMIAASEIGEDVVTDAPELAKVRELINRHLDEALSLEDEE